MLKHVDPPAKPSACPKVSQRKAVETAIVKVPVADLHLARRSRLLPRWCCLLFEVETAVEEVVARLLAAKWPAAAS